MEFAPVVERQRIARQIHRNSRFFLWLQCSESSLRSFHSSSDSFEPKSSDDAEIGELCELELANEQFDLYGFVRLLGFPFQTGPGEGFVGLPRGDHREGGILHADAAGHETIFQ